MIKNADVTLWILLLVYISLVFYLTIICREPSDEYKLELLPFKTIIGFFSVGYDGHGRYILRDVLVNVGLLMPVGFMLGFHSFLPKNGINIRKVIFYGFLISLSIETLQLISKTGTFEVDDLIYNTLGCAIGYLVCVGILSVCLRRENKTKFVIQNQT